MKSLLLTPTFLPSLTGNAVTVDRIRRSLSQAGVICKVLDLSRIGPDALLREAETFSPHVLHAFHAFKTGPAALNLKQMLHIPMITTMTGTDINSDIKTSGRTKIVRDVLHHSDRITVFNEQARSVLMKQRLPEERIAVIHQSVCLPASDEIDYRADMQIGRETPVVLMLGAIRSIKKYPYAIRVLERVRQCCRRPIHLIIAGPVLEDEAFRNIMQLMAGKDWISYIGEAPRGHIRSLFAAVDILLNTSSSESESNTILEAFSLGKIVIGRAIEGNASLLMERTGFCFHNRRDLLEKIIHVLNHPEDLEPIRRESMRVIQDLFQPAMEQTGYLQIYQRVQGCTC